MNKRNGLAVLLALLALVAFFAPHLFWVSMVANLGILVAKQIMFAGVIAGSVFVIGAVATVAKPIIKAIAGKKRRELAYKTRLTPLPRDENNLDVIKLALANVTSQYPNLTNMAAKTVECLVTIQGNIDALNNVITSNAVDIAFRLDATAEQRVDDLQKLYNNCCSKLVSFLYNIQATKDATRIEALLNAAYDECSRNAKQAESVYAQAIDYITNPDPTRKELS